MMNGFDLGFICYIGRDSGREFLKFIYPITYICTLHFEKHMGEILVEDSPLFIWG
jgi:hypothetical protein